MSNKIQRIKEGETSGLHIAMWDLETSGLAATFGGLYTASMKVTGQPVQTVRIDQFKEYKKTPWDDREVAKATRDMLESVHVLVGYNTFNFDIPFLNSRLVAHKLRVLSSQVKHVDLISVARHRLRLHSNRLESLLEHLGTSERKTPLEPELWRRAAAGDGQAMDKIVEHNQKDVTSLEEAFFRLLPFLDIQFRLIR